MTRFARAKGSKSSNEKAPEDSTPWEVMKDQLLKSKHENEESKAREQSEKKRIENYENFLKEQKVQKRKATWCDFPETESKFQAPNNEQHIKKKNKQKKEEKVETHTDKQNVSTLDDVSVKRKKKKNKSKVKIPVLNNTNQGNIKEKEDVVLPSLQKTDKKKKNKDKKSSSKESTDDPDNSKIANESNATNNTPKKKKKKKLVDGKPVRRKVEDDNSFQLIINGKEVVLVRYDGFPVMKKDAERLDVLKKSMMQKGIPKSEVQRTMKLERRRAEKALARLKREVCYNCRKGGHNLSDCPDLKSKIPGADVAEGVCFKCGSTEHRQFECKVQRDKEFRFATCFICKEPGHIARQCPDNPKGLYPNGGCCKLCGDVTHLRKDCPTVNEQKTETSIKLNTINSDSNLEDVGKLANVVAPVVTVKKPKKIKF